MNLNNNEFMIEDELNESNFSDVSSAIGMDLKEMVEKIHKLVNFVMKNVNGTNVGDQSGMMQMGLQIGEKFGELKKENEGLKNEMAKMMKAFEELKKANDGMKEKNAEKECEVEGMKKEYANGMAKIMDKLKELKAENKEMKETAGKLFKEIDKLKGEKSDEMEEMKKAIEGLKAANHEENLTFEKLKEENGSKLREMSKLIAQLSGMNAELEGKFVELNGENAELKEKIREMQGQIGELMVEQIGGVEWVKYNSNKFKFNAANCGPKITISEGGFIAKHSGPHEWNSVLANLPIPLFNLFGISKPRIVFYFEVHILKSFGIVDGIVIGFCGQQFPLEGKLLGNEKNSIGICVKGGMRIDGTFYKFGNANVNGYFSIVGNFVGIGIIHKPNSQMECFATWNGHLLGKVELPSKFVDLPLFPAISLFHKDDSIRVNFDMENCQFKKYERVLQ